MKKIILIAFLFATTFLVAQENYPQDINKKHEVKINALGLLAFEWVDVSYEQLINEESSFGIGILAGFDKNSDLDEYRKFSITPFYRRYFSNKFARGFFIEGFGMLHSYDNNNYDYYFDDFGNYYENYNSVTKTEFALGFSIGGKFISKSGFTTEIYLGLGRNLGGDDNSIEAVGRGGISLGYRF
ncbi:DUF3575 domain-containing protein [Polaribacter sargassicola]|uniref:DUF3575 domain-containing protein n=1 Tax=Polaribacter sargassicola TaxID=2836891 RepID=UPI001F2DD742|nr:DUF3575 domain-containing protein [Polaribacter sp. DS7-9]MCG1037540.1 DUF3575 domain-containing protein [Polaribacter sp. DS7-9]